MLTIGQRPFQPQDRTQAGHWEGDLIIGKDQGSAIGTLVERQTRMVRLLHLPYRDSDTLHDALKTRMADLPPALLRSITWDQGTEMARHRTITRSLGAPVYFCDSHSPWQCGSNENMNGLPKRQPRPTRPINPRNPRSWAPVQSLRTISDRIKLYREAWTRTYVQFKLHVGSSRLGLLCRARTSVRLGVGMGVLNFRASLHEIADLCEAAMSDRARFFLPAVAALLAATMQASAYPGKPGKGPIPESASDIYDVFVSYCEEDRCYWERIKVHLTPLDWEGVKIYDYNMVEAGAVIRQKTRSALLTSVVAVLLISADYLISDLMKDQLPSLLDQAESENHTRILRIQAGYCDLSQMERLTRYQPIGAREKPLYRLGRAKQDLIFMELKKSIVKTLIERGRYPKEA